MRERDEIRKNWVCNSEPKPAYAHGGGGVITYSVCKNTNTHNARGFSSYNA